MPHVFDESAHIFHDSKCLSTAEEAKVVTCEGANRAEKSDLFVPQFQALNVSDSEGETR